MSGAVLAVSLYRQKYAYADCRQQICNIKKIRRISLRFSLNLNLKYIKQHILFQSNT